MAREHVKGAAGSPSKGTGGKVRDDKKLKGKDQKRKCLLGEAENDHEAEFEAPGSLREVEGEVHVFLPSDSVKLCLPLIPCDSTRHE